MGETENAKVARDVIAMQTLILRVGLVMGVAPETSLPQAYVKVPAETSKPKETSFTFKYEFSISVVDTTDTSALQKYTPQYERKRRRTTCLGLCVSGEGEGSEREGSFKVSTGIEGVVSENEGSFKNSTGAARSPSSTLALTGA